MNLSKSDIEKMMNEYRNGASLKQLAKKYGVVKSTVSRYAKIYNISRTAPISKVYLVGDELFINTITSSKSWKEIATKLGELIVNTRFRGSVRKRCEDLGIYSSTITPKKPTVQCTKGELFSNKPNWWSASVPIRKHARKTYLASGRPQKCAVCGYDKCVEIAHIKPVADFSDDTFVIEINSLNNLVALCPTHHWEFDHNLLKL